MKKYRESDRVISKETERAFRCRYHNFEGLSIEETAKVMKVSEHKVHQLLLDMQRIAPALFPILESEEYEAWTLWFDRGLSCKEVAMIMKISEEAVKKRLQKIKKKKGYKHKVWTRRKDVVSLDYLLEIDPDAESGIRHQF